MADPTSRSVVSFGESQPASRVSSARNRPNSAGMKEFSKGDFSPRHKMTIGIPRREPTSSAPSVVVTARGEQESGIKLELRLDHNLDPSINAASERSKSVSGSVNGARYAKSQRSSSASSRRKFNLDIAATRNASIYIDWNKEYGRMDSHPAQLPLPAQLMTHRGSQTSRSSRPSHERISFMENHLLPKDTHENLQLRLGPPNQERPFVRFFKKSDNFGPPGTKHSEADERTADDVYDFKLEQRRATDEYRKVRTQQRRERELSEFRSKSVERILRAAERGEPFAISRLQQILNPPTSDDETEQHQPVIALSARSASEERPKMSKIPPEALARTRQQMMEMKRETIGKLTGEVSGEEWERSESEMKGSQSSRTHRPSTAGTIRPSHPHVSPQSLRIDLPPRAQSEMGMSEHTAGSTDPRHRRRGAPNTTESGTSAEGPRSGGRKPRPAEFDFESDVRALDEFDRKMKMLQKSQEAGSKR